MAKNKGTPKSSILIGFSIINHPFWGTIIFGNTHIGDYTTKKPEMMKAQGIPAEVLPTETIEKKGPWLVGWFYIGDVYTTQLYRNLNKP